MEDLSPGFLLSNAELVNAVAPWCCKLDNLELALIMAAQPGSEEGGVRRAELERRVRKLAAGLEIGPTYFQRVSRAVTSLEKRRILRVTGAGRSRRFGATPEGFGALILNLRVLRSDPTIDGSEFELKRSVVVFWNQVVQQLAELGVEPEPSDRIDEFFGELERVSVWGRPVITDDLVAEAFDVLGLVELQRKRVLVLQGLARNDLQRAQKAVDFAPSAPKREQSGSLPLPIDGGDFRDAMQAFVSAGTAAKLEARARIIRYDAYLEYLDALTDLYGGALEVETLESLRAAILRAG